MRVIVIYFIYRLTSLNIGCIKQNWSRDDLFNIINSLPITIQNLNISGFRGLITDKRK